MALKIEFDVSYINKDIDNIMRTALEDGIKYWCGHVDVVGEYLGEDASEQISLGGTLNFYNLEGDECYELTLDKFIDGLEIFIRRRGVCPLYNTYLSSIKIDAEDADAIVQYALFGDILYDRNGIKKYNMVY